MLDMISFSTQFLSAIPTFLMSEPINYIVGLCIFAYVIELVLRIRDLS